MLAGKRTGTEGHLEPFFFWVQCSSSEGGLFGRLIGGAVRHFPPNKLVLGPPETHEIVSAVFAPDALGPQTHQHPPCDRTVIMAGIPGGEIHAITPRTLRPEDVPQIPDLAGKTCIALPAAEMKESENLCNALGQRSREGRPDIGGSTLWTDYVHLASCSDSVLELKRIEKFPQATFGHT